MTEIPLFPLSSILLPYGRFSLQIFEQRYLDLVRSCMRTDTGFGVVWIRRGSEVATKGSARPDLGDYGTYARIVDWDQLQNGLLGITIAGTETFDLRDANTSASGLVMGDIEMHRPCDPKAMQDDWSPMLDVLRSLETHPHVQRMGLEIDYNNAWEVGYTLVQLLPLDESLKYELLGSGTIEEMMGELDLLLNQISGED
ncbi:MAG: LON peptidase substrate-binding domain-containing protein [Halioglobus sp.]